MMAAFLPRFIQYRSIVPVVPASSVSVSPPERFPVALRRMIRNVDFARALQGPSIDVVAAGAGHGQVLDGRCAAACEFQLTAAWAIAVSGDCDACVFPHRLAAVPSLRFRRRRRWRSRRTSWSRIRVRSRLAETRFPICWALTTTPLYVRSIAAAGKFELAGFGVYAALVVDRELITALPGPSVFCTVPVLVRSSRFPEEPVVRAGSFAIYDQRAAVDDPSISVANNPAGVADAQRTFVLNHAGLSEVQPRAGRVHFCDCAWLQQQCPRAFQRAVAAAAANERATSTSPAPVSVPPLSVRFTNVEIGGPLIDSEA